jgi:NADP-reducing hydrogenase subunit HndB
MGVPLEPLRRSGRSHMTTIQSLEDLQRFRDEVREEKACQIRSKEVHIVVSMGSCGIAAGAQKTMDAILAQIEQEHMHNVRVSQIGCSGLCTDEPIVQVYSGDKHGVTYAKVSPEIAQRILKEHVQGGKIVLDNVIENT